MPDLFSECFENQILRGAKALNRAYRGKSLWPPLGRTQALRWAPGLPRATPPRSVVGEDVRTAGHSGAWGTV